MNSKVRPRPAARAPDLHLPLDASPEQLVRLQGLQRAFAQACNALAPIVQRTRCWNRVTLHHLAYRELREQFPAIGSQMVCNAIYSVSRTSRLLFQHPASPFNVNRSPGKPLPLLRFTDAAPVYFDRHTLSLKDGRLSMYTLDGRIRFDLPVAPDQELALFDTKVREIVLTGSPAAGYELLFRFAQADDAALPRHGASGAVPEYIQVQESA